MSISNDEILHLLYEESDGDSEDLFGDDDTDADPDYQTEEDSAGSSDEFFTNEGVEDNGNEHSTDDEDNIQPQERVRNIHLLKGRNNYAWSTVVPERRGRVPARNLVTQFPGAKGLARTVKTPVESWKLLFDDHVLGEIFRRTNEEITRKFHQLELQGHALQSYHFHTSQEEVMAFIGLLYFAGFLKNNSRNLEELWSHDLGNPVFRGTMPLNRLKFLSICLRFDDKNTRLQRKENDKLAPIRVIWDRFVKNCTELYSPFSHCTIDEQLVSFRGRCPFRVYIKSKPDKYGMKIVMLNDVKTGYMLNAIPYVGKFKPPNREPIAAYYVRTLSEPIKGSNRNITVDNWFSSVGLFQTMAEDFKLTMVGTLRKDKPEIPNSFKTFKEAESSSFAFDHNKTLVVYSPQKNRNVILLSTMHYSAEIDRETNKPEIILFYNQTKGGTDTFDKLCHAYTVTRKNNRWPMRFFFAMLDQSGINSMVLYLLNMTNKRMTRRAYLHELSSQLIKPSLQVRLQTPTLRRNVRTLIEDILQTTHQLQQRQDPEPARKQRCFFCPRTRDRKTKNVCSTCRRPMCEDHRALVCLSCSE